MREQRRYCSAAKLARLTFPSVALAPKTPHGGYTFAGSRLLTCYALVKTAVTATCKTARREFIKNQQTPVQIILPQPRSLLLVQ